MGDGDFIAAVDGDKVSWASGDSASKIDRHGSDSKFVMIYDGEPLGARLEGGNKLVWDDGDIWIKEILSQASSKSRSTDRNVSSSTSPSQPEIELIATPQQGGVDDMD